MAIIDDGCPMYFVPNVKIDEKDLRLITDEDIQKIKLTEELKRDLSFCNLGLESLACLYCDKNGYVIKKIGGEFYMFKVKVEELARKELEMNVKRTGSKSDVQQEIEKKLLERLKSKLELNAADLKNNPTLSLSNEKATIEPDFYSEERRMIGEVHSHLGKLKAAQKHKISNDILKMLLFEKIRNGTFKKSLLYAMKRNSKNCKERHS